MSVTQTFQFISGDVWSSKGGMPSSKEIPPYLALRIALQVVIFHLQMNSRKSCWIELRHTVCCKEHDPLAIFHRAEEHRDDAIAEYIPGCTFLEKHIRLIEQQDRIPMSRNLKDLEELALEPTCISRQVSGRYLEMLEEACFIEIQGMSSYRVHRLPAMFRYSLRCQGLSHPGIATLNYTSVLIRRRRPGYRTAKEQ